MDSKEMKLFRALQVGEMTLKNRIVMAPMTRGRAGDEMIANNLMAEYYSQRAAAGLIITEGTFVSPGAVGWLHAPGIYTGEMQRGWEGVVQSVHDRGGTIFLQLWHTGRASHRDFLRGEKPVAPSSLVAEGGMTVTPKSAGQKVPYEWPRELESDEIPKIVDEYRSAAQRAKDAGFDGVEIHAANGYLIDTFLQSRTNLRTDKYGGSLENRFEFLKEIVEAVHTVWPLDRMGVRISPQGVYNDMGSPDYREQFLYVADQLSRYHMAYLHIIIGLGMGFHHHGKPMELSEFRDVYEGAIIANGGFTHELAEHVLTLGHADLVAFGRPFISNPDLVERIENSWPLAAMPPDDALYSAGADGYTDWPRYKEHAWA